MVKAIVVIAAIIAVVVVFGFAVKKKKYSVLDLEASVYLY